MRQSLAGQDRARQDEKRAARIGGEQEECACLPGYLLISWIRVLPSVWFLVLWYATRLIFDAPRPNIAAAKIGKVQENNEDSKSTVKGQLSRQSLRLRPRGWSMEELISRPRRRDLRSRAWWKAHFSPTTREERGVKKKLIDGCSRMIRHPAHPLEVLKSRWDGLKAA